MLKELVANLDSHLAKRLENASRPLLAFSGGKDCLVIQHRAKHLGFELPLVHARTNGLDWPQHLEYMQQFSDLLLAKKNVGLDWLRKNPRYLFPRDSKTRNEVFRMIQRETCQRFSYKYNCDVLLWGRRDQENTVRHTEYLLRNTLQVHPIRHWRTDQVWEYLRGNRVEVSPLYSLPLSEKRGVHRWHTRVACEEEPHPWKIIAKHAPEIADHAQWYFPEVKKWL